MTNRKPTLPEDPSDQRILFPIKTYFIFFYILSLLAIVLFVVKFWGHGWSDDPADWGVFGDYFGGVLNPLVGLITLIVTIQIAVRLNAIEKRNHDDALNSQVKPLITIQEGVFFSADISRIGLTAQSDFYSYNEPTQPITPFSHVHQEPFSIKVNNLGLGVAKDVKLEFDIDLSKCKEAIDFSDSRVKVLMEDQGKDVVTGQNLSLLSWKVDASEKGSAKIKSPIRKLAGIVNNHKEAYINVPIPSEIMTAFQLFNLRRKLSNTDKEFPTVYVIVQYKNIHDKELEVKFRLGFFSIQDYPKLSI